MPSPAYGLTGTVAQAAAPATTISPTLPAHAAGDLLMLAVCNSEASGRTFTIDNGWAGVTADLGQSFFSARVFWKRAASAAEANPTVTCGTALSTTGTMYAHCWTITGVTSSDPPYEAGATLSAAGTSGGTTITGSALAALGQDRLAVSVLLIDTNRGQAEASGNWTVKINSTSPANGSDRVHIGVCTYNTLISSPASSVAPVHDVVTSFSPGWITHDLFILPADAAHRTRFVTLGGGIASF